MGARPIQVVAGLLCVAGLLLGSVVGCELVASVDRDKIPNGAGGGATGGSGGGATTSQGAGGSGGTGGAQCSAPSDCPDPGNECIARTCVGGACGTEPVADGGPVTRGQTSADCKKLVCDGVGATKTVDDDNDVFDDGKGCTDDTCAAGSPKNDPTAAGASCSEGGGVKCDGLGACVECLLQTDCPGEFCDGTHHCVPATCNDGQKDGDETDVDCGGACGATCDPGEICAVAADCTSGVCTALVCAAPACGDGVDNGDETDVDCGGSCVQKCGPGQGCAINADCAGNQCTGTTCVANCADGVENNAETDVDCGGGTCPDCADGLGCTDATDCASGGCCGAPSVCDACCNGVADGSETDVDCGGGACSTCADGQLCGQSSDCTSALCQAGACVPPTCGNGAKDGSETDVDCGGPCAGCANGQACIVSADCASNLCQTGVCVPTTCNDGSLDGTETDVDCGGPACLPCTNGKTCSAPGDCASGACVDGVCCNSACAGTCQACSAAKTGGTNGVCGNVVVDTDPDNECAAGECDGAGACEQTNGAPCAQPAQCQSGFCVDGVCCNGSCANTCRACSAAKKGSGADGTCGFIGAGSDPDNECAGATTCDGAGACLLATGAVCSVGTQCQSGFCVDGVCCGSACASTCQACSAAKTGGSDGTCASISTGTDPDNECAGSQICDGAGACKKINGDACAAGAECQSGFCVDGVCCNGSCANTCRACTAAKKGSGSDGTCSFIANGTDPDNECVGATTCNGAGACALLGIGSACSVNGECASSFCADGVCCNVACGGLCQACSAAKSGGADGTCAAIVAGTDPDNECGGATPNCNGAGMCGP